MSNKQINEPGRPRDSARTGKSRGKASESDRRQHWAASPLAGDAAISVSPCLVLQHVTMVDVCSGGTAKKEQKSVGCESAESEAETASCTIQAGSARLGSVRLKSVRASGADATADGSLQRAPAG